MTRELYIGVMSGTSLDGVDTVLVAIEDQHLELIAHYEHSLPDELKQRLLNVALGQPTHLLEIGTLDHQLGHLFADAVNALLKQSGYQATLIRAIGNHGQTVFHHPTGDFPFTTQLGDANIIATKTGIDTVADFRRKDMALGGQGAPLVPAFHQTIFQPIHSSVVILNIGGIANISVLRPNETVIGYDTGPGNMLLDAWCHQHTGMAFDRDAALARQGKLIPDLLTRLLNEPYLARSYPKSTGRELFNLPWLEAHLQTLPHHASFLPQDVQHTLCEYSAQTIAQQVEKFSIGSKPELLVCGGGACNPLLMQRLAALLPQWKVETTDSRGISSDYMEAMAFAWLAQRRIHGLPSNLPEVTGATTLASLGVLYFA